MNSDPPDLERLRAVLALTQQQTAALAAEAIDRFDQLLEEREALIGQLGTGSNSVESLSEAEAIVMENTAREIIDQDRRNHAALGERLHQIRTELPILTAGNRATDAYRTTPEASAAYVDRSS